MKPLDIRDLVRFSDDEPRHQTLHESERVWSEVVCLQGSQGVGPMSDAASDAILTVLAGEVASRGGVGDSAQLRFLHRETRVHERHR